MARDNSGSTLKLFDILERKHLGVLFQPIIDLSNGSMIGYEGQIRGPADDLLHAPFRFLRLAKQVSDQGELYSLLQSQPEISIPFALSLSKGSGCVAGGSTSSPRAA
jgi:hypothetical protein